MSITAKQFIDQNQDLIEEGNLPAIFEALSDTPNFTPRERDLAAFVIFYTLDPDSFAILDNNRGYPVVVLDSTCSVPREGYYFGTWHCPGKNLSDMVDYRVGDDFDDKLREVLINVGTQLFCSRGGKITSDMIKKVINRATII